MRYTYDVYEFNEDISKPATRIDTSTKLQEAAAQLRAGRCIEVTDNLNPINKFFLRNQEEIDEHQSDLEQEWSRRKDAESEMTPLDKVVQEIGRTHRSNEPWDPFNEKETEIHMVSSKDELRSKKVDEAVDPSHYQNFLQLDDVGFPVSLQWIEVEFRKPQFRDNPQAIEGALLFQINKYLSRLGEKDDEIQELKKALWYLNYLIAFESNGRRPLLVKDMKTFKDK